MANRLDALHRGFRTRYLGFEELTAQLQSWAENFPELVRLRSIGESLEGRPLWLVTIGPQPDRIRPSAWVDANMHATELCGSSVALAIAEDVIRLHLDPDAPCHELPEGVRARLRDVLVHVLPRISPDGAESVLTTGRYSRSAPRDRRPNRGHPRWLGEDVDGDGLALLLRKVDPTGELVESRDVPGLMLPRRIDDEGPFYKVWPEGTIENFTGDVPDPSFLGDNDVDLNRNFPFMWAPEPQQVGAGPFAASEPESRAIIEQTTRSPEIFAWIDFHTFGGVFIRPLGHEPDNKMDRGDLALFRQIARWAEELTGYPTVSGHDDFLYEPDKPLHGDLSDFAYHQRGAVSYVVELWDLFAQLGIERKKPFVDHYSHLTREELERLGRWDREHNASRLVRPWRPVDHPQLGAVEVGGLDTRVGISNPPYDQLPEVCRRHAAHALRVIALAPAVVLESCAITEVGGGLRRVDVTVANHGYLPTFVLSSAKKLPWNEPLHVDVTCEGCALVTPTEAHREVGHLDGWGRGLFDDEGSIFFQRSRGSTGRKTLRWMVRGEGRFTLRVGSCRTGFLEQTLDIR
ncbi:MAG: peptidase M14 [Deltaproteobacteria bacterium]|nr:peptidase M14 [Deltaproteobacteria bacterium]